MGHVVITAFAGLGTAGCGLPLISHKCGCFREITEFRAVGWGFFPSLKARREDKTCRREKPPSRKAERGVTAHSGCKYRQHSPTVLLCLWMGRREQRDTAFLWAPGGQDHEEPELWAVRDPAVGQMATAEHLSGGISYRRCWHLLFSPVAASCQLLSLPMLMSPANLPSFLLSYLDYYFPLSLERTMLEGKRSCPAPAWLLSAV